MYQIPSLEEMLKAGLHFGHKVSRWHPKMAPYIFGAKAGVHIIDLEATNQALERACEFVRGIGTRGGVVLFVGTKPQAKQAVSQAAESCTMPHVVERWLGGTLTNYQQLKRRLKELKTLKERRDKGELRKYTKMEQLMLSRQIEDMQKKFGGIENLERIPDAVFIADVKSEKTALREAEQMGVPIIALCDTNVNPAGIAYVIPGNDDARLGIELIARTLASAIQDGLANPVKEPEAAVVKKAKAPRKDEASEEKSAKTKETVE